jgi:hypothetical protein
MGNGIFGAHHRLRKRSAMKLQVLADFIADWTEPASYNEGLVTELSWQVYCDGAWGSTGVGAATILISPFGIKLRYTSCLEFTKQTNKFTNNIATYEV